MDAAKPRASDTPARLASGIEAGVIGGLAMLGLLVSGSLLRGHVWWEIPNLLGSTFYGARAFRLGPGMATTSGAALQFTLTGALGALFSLTCGAIRERRHLIPLGILAGIVWYYVAGDLFWERVNPLVPEYIDSRYGAPAMVLLSNVALGACLGYVGRKESPGQTILETHAIPEPYPLLDADDMHDSMALPETEAAQESHLRLESHALREVHEPGLILHEEPSEIGHAERDPDSV